MTHNIKMLHSVLQLLLILCINLHFYLAGGKTLSVETDNSTDVVTFAATAEYLTFIRDSNLIKLKVLVALPLDERTNYDDSKIQRWDRGFEVLPGAQVAVEAINNDPCLLPGYELILENVSTDLCIVQEVQTNLNAFIPFANGTLDNNTVGMLGLFCSKLLRNLSPLAGRKEFGLFQISGTTSTDVRGKLNRYTHLNYAAPSEAAYYETFFKLMHELEWRRALIVDDNFFNHMTHVRNSSLLTKNLSMSFLEFSGDVTSMPVEIRLSEKNIVFLSAGLKQTADLLCAVYDEGLTWPHYMWVIQDHEINELLSYANGKCTTRKLMAALQNVLFLRFQYKQTDTSKELVTGSTYETYIQQYMKILNESGGKLKYNRYANTMHDSVWAFALALNHSLDTIATYNMTIVDFVKEFGREKLTNTIEDNLRILSFEGVSGRMEFNRDYDIEAIVFITLADSDGKELTLGYYDQLLQNMFLNKRLFPTDLPGDKLPCIYKRIPISVTTLLIILVILCFLLTTIMFALFIKYRRYSEIKATSPYLSFLMFAGTYFILVSTFIQATLTVVVSPPDHIISATLCGSVITGNVVGINLIFSTLLLRILRVYHIFSYFGKTGKIWSDKFLAIIVLFVVGGDTVLLLIWFCLDPYTIKEAINYVYKFTVNPRIPYYEVSQYCSSDEIHVWFSLTFGKVGILFAIVLFLAIKTRKIQRANFKDTKKVNIYIFITVMIVATLIPLWFLLKRNGNVTWLGVLIYLSFGSIGLFNQIMLFSPKVLPPILRSIGIPVGHTERSRTTIIRKKIVNGRALTKSQKETRVKMSKHSTMTSLSIRTNHHFSSSSDGSGSPIILHVS